VHSLKSFHLQCYISVTFDACLAAQSIGIHRDAHVFFAVIALIEVRHAFADRADACCAKSVPAAGVFHRNIIIECDLENGLSVRRIDRHHLGAEGEGNFGHENWRVLRRSPGVKAPAHLFPSGKYRYHSGLMASSALLSVHDLHISIEGKEVVSGLSLEVRPGEVHAVMGPNGSGKSTLVNTLMGHPKYLVTDGSASFLGKDLLSIDAAKRAQAGLFLAFQYPKEIAGVSLRSFLFAAYNAQMAVRDPQSKKISPIKFRKFLEEQMRELHMDPSFAERFVNQGFSGGEKKKAEVLQLQILRPLLALLDETDSGLDIDALKVVAEGINTMRGPHFSAVLVTHYARLLEYIRPDHVHVMVGGKIVESGGMELAEKLEKNGYAEYGVKERGIELDM